MGQIKIEVILEYALSKNVIAERWFFCGNMSPHVGVSYTWTTDILKVKTKSQQVILFLNKLILRFILKDKTPRIVRTILKKNVRGCAVPDIKTHYKAVTVKIVLYWQNNRQIDQQNKIELPKIDPYRYSQLILDKGAKSSQWREE